MTDAPMTPDDDDRAARDTGPDPADPTGALIRAQASRHRADAALQARVRAEIALAAAAGDRGAVAAGGRGRGGMGGVAALAGRRTWWIGGGGFAAGLATGALALLLWVAPAAPDGAAAELVSMHVRALQAGHLTDVAASDQHVVKPWFQGRLDFAPPVEDFAADGYPLAGGRLDYLAGRPVAALVYRRHQHVINLLVWPARDAADAPSAALRDAQGYHVVQWRDGAMRFAAVSDVNVAELQAFERLWAARAPGASRRD